MALQMRVTVMPSADGSQKKIFNAMLLSSDLIAMAFRRVLFDTGLYEIF
jgi:hypothetical protein